MDYIFYNDRPIYIQLLEYMKIYLISGVFKCGDKLPSVREFATTFKVNPNTMQKALVELENEGLVYTERTNGKFVTTEQELIEKVKKELAKEKVNHYLQDMKNIGITYEESIQYLHEIGGK